MLIDKVRKYYIKRQTEGASAYISRKDVDEMAQAFIAMDELLKKWEPWFAEEGVKEIRKAIDKEEKS